MADDVLLNKAATIVSESLQHMVAFRNIAVHDYQSLLLPIVESVITQHLDEFLQFSKLVLQRAG